MANNLFSFKDLIKRTKEFKWYYALIFLLVLSIPYNHKEAFSVYDPDLVWSKYVLGSLAALGLYFVARNYRRYFADPFFLLLLSFVLFQVLSLTQTGDFIDSLRIIAFQSAVTFAYIPIKDFIAQRKGALRSTIFLYAISVIPVFIFLIVQIYLQSNYQVAIGGIWPVPGYPTRYGSTFWDINHFGAFCSALTLILLGFIQTKGLKTAQRVFIGFVIGGLLSALYLTSSRSSMLGFGVGLITFLVLNTQTVKVKISEKAKNILIYWGTIVVTSGLLLLIQNFADSIKNALLYRSVSFFSHLFLLKVGIIVGFQHFMFGIGANSFHAYFRNTEWAKAYYFIDKAALNLKLPLHNLWLEVLAETGLVSLIFFTGFWLLLLFGLYRIYVNTKEKLAIGFIGGITAFLVGGVMYSYKSEFFWVFVLVASAYVAREYFTDVNVKIIPTIKEIICSGRCDFLKAGIFILSVVTLVLPIFYIVQPLNDAEINLFYGAFESNFIANLYTDILMLFRYVIGNYSYTGRLVSLLFYAGSITLSYLVAKRYLGDFYSIVLVAVAFGIANVIEPNLIVSIKWFIAFALLCIAGLLVIILAYINRRVTAFNIGGQSLNTILAISLICIISVGAIFNSNFFKKSYANDLFFLMELAYNRGFLNEALVQVGNSIELNSVYYFVDNVMENSDGFYIREGVAVPVSGFDLTNYKKNIFVYSTLDSDASLTNSLVGSIQNGNVEVEVTELSQGEYKIVMIERRATVSP